ncbi:MAG: hypothetical protein QOF75_1685 [Gaiellaceae bacterium]|jgi:hypothetical protein|nr:hypothetical protein [Gaiellaceae bacterium]MDX6471329.1 hypothetical protein [Gaiellaceae bacterium]
MIPDLPPECLLGRAFGPRGLTIVGERSLNRSGYRIT